MNEIVKIFRSLVLLSVFFSFNKPKVLLSVQYKFCIRSRLYLLVSHIWWKIFYLNLLSNNSWWTPYLAWHIFHKAKVSPSKIVTSGISRFSVYFLFLRVLSYCLTHFVWSVRLKNHINRSLWLAAYECHLYECHPPAQLASIVV